MLSPSKKNIASKLLIYSDSFKSINLPARCKFYSYLFIIFTVYCINLIWVSIRKEDPIENNLRKNIAH